MKADDSNVVSLSSPWAEKSTFNFKCCKQFKSLVCHIHTSHHDLSSQPVRSGTDTTSVISHQVCEHLTAHSDPNTCCQLLSWFTSPPKVGAKLCRVCRSVCLLAYLGNNTAELHQFSVHVDCGRGSAILWRRCDMLCTSGVVGDVTFSHNGPYAKRWELSK